MSSIDTLPPLRTIVKKYGLNAKKNLGQNFLFDLNLTQRIVASSGSLEGYTIIEVGPGPGGLTRSILASGAERVIVIERDERCLPALEEISNHYPNKLTIINDDALSFNPIPLLEGRKAKVIANLPYNIGTNLLLKWLLQKEWPSWWDSLTLMFQKEVADRITATAEQPKDYGRLGVLVGWRCYATSLFDIAPSAFVPPPKVTSTVVHIAPRPSPIPCSIESLEQATRAAFGQRRKMLRQSLKSLGIDTPKLIKCAGLKETARAEELSVQDYVKLAQCLTEK